MIQIELTEAEYEICRRLIGREVSGRKLDSNHEDQGVRNFTSILLPSRENLLDKFPIRPAAFPRISRHRPPEVF